MADTQKVTVDIIGNIHSPHKTIENVPIQSVGAKKFVGIAEIDPVFAEGLLDLDGFSHIMLIYYFHKQNGYSLKVKPFMDNKEHGVFATRAPKRPAKIGLSTVKILRIEGNKIYFEGADMLDGTPLIDIKPFFRQMDNRPDAVCGWLDTKDKDMAQKTRSDDRFA